MTQELIILRCYSNFISAYFLHAGNDYPILDRNPEIMLAPQGENTTFVCKFPPVNRTEDLMYGVRWLINDRVVEEMMLYNQTDPVELYLNKSYLHSHKFGTKVWTWSISFIAFIYFFGRIQVNFDMHFTKILQTWHCASSSFDISNTDLSKGSTYQQMKI